MTCSAGQKLAKEQIERLAASQSSAIEIHGYAEPKTAGARLIVNVKIRCDQYERTDDGLPLRAKEHFCISIPVDFPFDYPQVDVPHIRFSGFPHVQWRRHLCLYQAPDTEWNPSDGMFGFFQRLDTWLAHGARNDLDPVGDPLHPPAIYPSASRSIVAKENTPVVTDAPWFGFANLSEASALRFDLDCWYELLEKELPKTATPAILLDQPFPFEYPKNVKDTIDELERLGISRSILMLCLQMGAANTETGSPMYIVIGTPMRGIGGEGNMRKQHLAVWEISADAVDTLKLVIRSEKLLENINEENLTEAKNLVADIKDIFDEWASVSEMKWCRVMEARSEVVERRDGDSPMHWFDGKKVMIWGCGALGGHVAESIVRAGVRSLVLYDNKTVTPGIIQRQNFTDRQIGYTKSSALSVRLKEINPLLETDFHHNNIVSNVLKEDVSFDDVDIIIDTTASSLVSAKLEAIWQQAKLSVPIASMVINSNTDCGLLAICLPDHSGGPYDVFRRIGISTKNRYFLKKYTNQFWPEEKVTNYFQPEPGCSDPTFRGSHADVTGLAALMVNQVAKDIQKGGDVDWSARGHLIPTDKQYPAPQIFSYRADHVINIATAGTEVRLTDFAWREMQGWINRSKRVVGEKIETGGLLFGDLDEAVNVLWVNEILGPPPDSQASETLFECGVKGTQEANEEKISRSRGAISYVGTWHTHPISAPVPSETDYAGMYQILSEQGLQTSRQLLLIAGYTTKQTKIGAHIFNASMARLSDLWNVAEIQHESGFLMIGQPSELTSSLGLTLSGGGSRAIAFHLGCLRALQDMGLLSDVRAISAVSGGSVMAALYAYENDEFSSFENRVLMVLRKGLVRPAIIKLFTSMYWPKIIVTWTLSGIAALTVKILRITMSLIAKLFQIQRIHHPDWIDRLRAPFRRWYSITSILESVLTDEIGDKKLNECARENLDVIFNACEMRTGTAFRFSNNGSRSWRYGTVADNDISVGHAVSASAAYPAMLPAHDKNYKFKKNGIVSRKSNRTIITDGGVYDNLGISAIEPGRYQKDSITNVEPDVIICCDAGAGQFSGYIIPYGWGSRMARALESTFRKVQDASKARLHTYAEKGDIKAFIYSYLGQVDNNLPLIPADLIPREDIAGYPTDFFAMKDEHLDQLAARGEVLTRYLISRYLLDD